MTDSKNCYVYCALS